MNLEKSSSSTIKIADHKKVKKTLVPPFAQIKNLEHVSLLNQQVPDMIWTALIMDVLSRDKALSQLVDIVVHAVKIFSTNL